MSFQDECYMVLLLRIEAFKVKKRLSENRIRILVIVGFRC